MTAVATRTHASVHAAYLDKKERLGVSAAALYDKLNLLELGISIALIRDTSVDAAKQIDAMPAASKVILPGLEVFYLDADPTMYTEHRLAALAARAKGRCQGSRWRCWMPAAA